MVPLIFVYGEAEKYRNYTTAVQTAGGQLRFSLRIPEAVDCNGLLLPGGGDLDPALYGAAPQGSEPPDRRRDAAELELIESFAAAKKPVFGICRGMQCLNVFFGGSLVQDIPGHRQLHGRDVFHSVRAEPGMFPVRQYGKSFLVNSAHHQAIDRTGAGIRAVCTAEDGTIEAIAHETLPIFAVQWHPERLTGSSSRLGAADGARLFDFFLSRLSGKEIQEKS